jgi:hypothetical protein
MMVRQLTLLGAADSELSEIDYSQNSMEVSTAGLTKALTGPSNGQCVARIDDPRTIKLAKAVVEANRDLFAIKECLEGVSAVIFLAARGTLSQFLRITCQALKEMFFPERDMVSCPDKGKHIYAAGSGLAKLLDGQDAELNFVLDGKKNEMKASVNGADGREHVMKCGSVTEKNGRAKVRCAVEYEEGLSDSESPRPSM